MKIAILTRFNQFHGGVESVNSWISKIFVQAGHLVDILSFDDIPPSLKTPARLRFFGEPRVLSHYFKNDLENYDIVICNGEFGYQINHPKCINIFHGSSYGYRKAIQSELGPRSFLKLYRMERFQKKAADNKYVIAVSDDLKKILSEQGICVNQTLENCVDLDHFRPPLKPSPKQDYLFVGSYDYKGKGFDILCDIAQKGLSISCVTSYCPHNELQHLPQQDNDTMPQVYAKHRALIFPSRFEGLQMVPLEAMACGLPVVISNVGLGKKLIEYIPEFVVESQDPQDYVDRIASIESRYEHFSKLALEYVKTHHCFDHYKTQWLDVINSL